MSNLRILNEDGAPTRPAALSPYMRGFEDGKRVRTGERVPCPFHPASDASDDWLLGLGDGEREG